MNIKIKSAGVTCLVGEDYDRVYAALKKQLGDGQDQLFSERTPGHEYLQWELPGDGWQPLSGGDPLMEQEVRRQLQQRRQRVTALFGNNAAMAQRILYVPDDNYIYYKPDGDGQLLIRLAAWGYRYPEPIITGPMTGNAAAKVEKSSVSVRVVSGGHGIGNMLLRLNGYRHTTDPQGVYDIGQLPVGYQFDLDVADQHHHIVVTPDLGEIVVDLTPPVEEKPEPPVVDEQVPPVVEERQEPPVDVEPPAEEEPPVVVDPEPPVKPEVPPVDVINFNPEPPVKVDPPVVADPEPPVKPEVPSVPTRSMQSYLLEALAALCLLALICITYFLCLGILA